MVDSALMDFAPFGDFAYLMNSAPFEDFADLMDFSPFGDFADTIAAIATAPGVGAISLVRLSGKQAKPIMLSLFSPFLELSRKDSQDIHPSWLKSHRAVHGYFFASPLLAGSFASERIDHQKRECIDEVIVTPFFAPHSYTSEDLVEISCHGNPLIARRILATIIQNGARLARPGEFTERAFLSGKIDLTQAEAVLDLIQAKTDRQSKIALTTLKGELGEQIRIVRQKLINLLTAIVAGVDFPEEIGETPKQDIEGVLLECRQRLEDLAKTARSGRFLREGLKLAIVGRPNAGKSSLLNALLKIERAIVTDIPGTTRDSLAEHLEINGIPVILVDTAGIRETDDQVEKMGIKRTYVAIDEAQLVLMVVDLTQGWQQEEDKILAKLGTKPRIILGNKSDLVEIAPQSFLAGAYAQNSQALVQQILISAKTHTNKGIEILCQTIEQWVLEGNSPEAVGACLNERQAILCDRTIQSLYTLKETLLAGMPQDCLATDLKTSIDLLSEMCGEVVSEEIITEVFANFCIGK